MILPVRPFNDSVLHSPCMPVGNPCEGLDKTIVDMWETMEAHKGVGLAANQVAIPMRFFVANLEKQTRKLVVINPTIIELGKDKEKATEGCLSAPAMTVTIKRPTKVVVQFETFPSREVVTYEFTGWDARIMLHEIDHLNGKMIISHIFNPNIVARR